MISYNEELDKFFVQHRIPLPCISLKHKVTLKYETHHLFLKCAPAPDNAEDLSPQIEYPFFKKESDIYMKLFPEFMKYFKCEEFAPRGYYGSKELMVLEDMRKKNYKRAKDVFFTKKQLFGAAKALARLHACSLLYQTQEGKSSIFVCINFNIIFLKINLCFRQKKSMKHSPTHARNHFFLTKSIMEAENLNYQQIWSHRLQKNTDYNIHVCSVFLLKQLKKKLMAHVFEFLITGMFSLIT